jgi:TM2 domain-containing membrane protein YozV
MSEAQISNEKKLTLLLLCWLVGLFGLHRFYTGKYHSGSLQLLMLMLAGMLGFFEAESLIALPVILILLWWVIDVLFIIMGRFTDKDGKPIIDWV